MSGARSGYSDLEGFTRPLIVRPGWPEPVEFSEGVLRAVLLEGFVDKDRFIEALVVNREEKFLQLESFGETVRVTSGDFVGAQSRTASVVVKLGEMGQAIPPARGIRRLLPRKSNDIVCTWHEAVAVSLHFVGLGQMPPGLAWWHEGGG